MRSARSASARAMRAWQGTCGCAVMGVGFANAVYFVAGLPANWLKIYVTAAARWCCGEEGARAGTCFQIAG